MKTLILTLTAMVLTGCSSFNTTTTQDTITIVNTQCESIRCFETVNRAVRDVNNPYRKK